MIILKSEQEIAAMRRAGRLAAEALREVVVRIRPGVATRELDEVAEAYIRRHGGVPSFKGYRGFPASICASIDDEVVHGIPGRRKLRPGQIVSVDLGVLIGGFHGDVAVTVPAGEVDPQTARLLQVTREALGRGVAQVRPGARLGDVARAIQEHAEAAGFSVVRDFAGHGIGRNLHEEPQVPNFGQRGTGNLLKPGVALAIEPMVNRGGPEVTMDPDGWTVRTRDGSPSAHFEHTVVVTRDGVEILTGLDGESLLD
ncbi:MAG: type I methionyl aminopeptidase [Armatimonadetes bacterium]|nr:type I methionyl aminopeptidase [Armatimonadota bacterium]